MLTFAFLFFLAPAYTVQHYALHLSLDLERRAIQGIETIHLRFSGEAASEIHLDAHEMIVDSVFHLQGAFEKAAGSKLDGFFNQWIYH